MKNFAAFSLIIIFFALALRIYRVAGLPHDLYVDEVSIGYNAYSILTTGKDEHGEFLPLFFAAFGEYKLPVYIYLTSVSEFIFGKNALAVRLPSVLAGTLTVGFTISLIFLLTKNKRLSLVSGFLLATSPWHLQFSRAGFEANLFLLFLICGIYLWFLAMGKKKPLIFFGSLTSFILALYTYNAAKIIVPLLAVFLLSQNWPKIKSVFFLKKTYIFVFPAIMLLIPFILFSFSPKGLVRFQSESFLRQISFDADDFFQNFVYRQGKQLVQNYSQYFSADFLFFAGDGNGRHSVREMGMQYVWQLPFFFLGLCKALKKREKADVLFLSLFFLSPIPAAITLPNPHALRALSIVLPLVYFIGMGMEWAVRSLFAKITIVFITSYFLLSYLHIYYVHYPKKTSSDWSDGYARAIQLLTAAEKSYETIAVSKNLENGYVYLYFYGNFNKEDLGNYKFVDSPYMGQKGKILYLSPFWEKWHGREREKIYNRAGDHLFTLWEN